MTGILRARRAALATIAVLVAAASLVSFAESYRGLYDWASRHGLSGPWAVAWPLQVNVFIAVGELALFVALADAWPTRSRAAAWLVTLAGLAVSVAGNVGHVAGHSAAARVTAAVPPLAAASALAVGLGVLKRVVAARGSTAVPAPHPSAPGNGHGAPEGGAEAAQLFATELARGALPSVRRCGGRCTLASRERRRCARTWPHSTAPDNTSPRAGGIRQRQLPGPGHSPGGDHQEWQTSASAGGASPAGPGTAHPTWATSGPSTAGCVTAARPAACSWPPPRTRTATSP